MKSERQVKLDAVFERLFSEYRRPILNYLCRLLGDVSRAEELTQDVFVKAYRALERLPADANYRAWLYRVATNAAYDQLRRRKLLKWLPLFESDGAEPTYASPDRTVPEREAVQSALMQLPAKYRAPLVLYSIQGYSTREIAKIMGITKGAVKTRLFRAREKFRDVYGGEI